MCVAHGQVVSLVLFTAQSTNCEWLVLINGHLWQFLSTGSSKCRCICDSKAPRVLLVFQTISNADYTRGGGSRQLCCGIILAFFHECLGRH